MYHGVLEDVENGAAKGTKVFRKNIYECGELLIDYASLVVRSDWYHSSGLCKLMPDTHDLEVRGYWFAYPVDAHQESSNEMSVIEGNGYIPSKLIEPMIAERHWSSKGAPTYLELRTHNISQIRSCFDDWREIEVGNPLEGCGMSTLSYSAQAVKALGMYQSLGWFVSLPVLEIIRPVLRPEYHYLELVNVPL